MRERQNRQVEEDEEGGQTEGQEPEEASPGAAPSEVPIELRGVLLEEQTIEKPTVGAEGVIPEEGMLYILTDVLPQPGEVESVVLQLQDEAQVV